MHLPFYLNVVFSRVYNNKIINNAQTLSAAGRCSTSTLFLKLKISTDLHCMYVNNNIHTGYRVHVKYRRDLLFCYFIYFIFYIMFFSSVPVVL